MVAVVMNKTDLEHGICDVYKVSGVVHI